MKKRKRSIRLDRRSCIVYLKENSKWVRYTSKMSKEEHIVKFKVDSVIGIIPLVNMPETHIELRRADFGYGIVLQTEKLKSILQESCSDYLISG